jgi:uncharacterized membrane protein (TIGR02234 family)
MADRRGTFGPVVLVGLAGAALAAVAGARPWVDVSTQRSGSDADARDQAMASTLSMTVSGESPLAAALALVVLACWGVVLVTRGRVRRGTAALGAVAGLGLAATVVSAPWLLRDDVAAEVRQIVGGSVEVGLTAWWGAALLAAVLVVATTVLAVRLVPRWPEMGARYDAPADAASAQRRTPTTGIDMWKALDEGRDPTAEANE